MCYFFLKLVSLLLRILTMRYNAELNLCSVYPSVYKCYIFFGCYCRSRCYRWWSWKRSAKDKRLW